VAGRADRQVFGEAFDDGEDYGLPEVQSLRDEGVTRHDGINRRSD